MTQEEKGKLRKLQDFFSQAGSAAVAYSGGVDSTLLVKVAHEVLKDKMAAISLVSKNYPSREREQAVEFCRSQNIPYIEIEYDELAIPGFSQNPLDRCYLCKRELFTMIRKTAAQKGLITVCEGSNMDDMGDYRPGLRAIKEMEIKSPLQIAGLTKQEIRSISRDYNLPTWNKPSMACLATRIAYGQTITREKLEMVGKAEQILVDLGFNQVRVRLHGDVARIELLPQDFGRFMEDEVRTKVAGQLKSIGFSYVTLDLQGFRSGSMNEGKTPGNDAQQTTTAP